ncbi:T9SS type A sorting domain-containing protein [Epilithonimonas ginsengisoli]|uniref:T9SS type A sorting domain-containing protein n=1 Tax=Epilithonimonas ginsengisoli TaxID=1245592 RepID=A0ABU4JK64_9FLAO|nr:MULTISPECIES: T9SS type A sorting domain-containing protein [Chryseobacterium group]MBV6881082.1 T9SS type A sorting domain-containing protein [Epilithonimonas sp. FP105]MDW8549933.1 T9SS type A sorting domain-containing protein [Epilithonimonas ginsengisoli]OAH76551.1 hypothetical protein AXA65_00755 [Chryseobacterium sp. FP211-J200]
MKNKYLLILSVISSFAFAQQNISFESSEGYTLGDINGQNGWTVTESSDGPLTNQIVTNERASSGTYAFKNAHVAQFGDQWFPIFGIEKSFSPALDYKNTTISYDFYSSDQNGSDFEFALYHENLEDEVFDIVTAVGFENRGNIYIYPDLNLGGYTITTAKWQVNRWYNLKIEFTEANIKYYLDNNLILSVANNSKVNLDGMNFLHNNFGGDAYYDNIIVNDEVLAVNDAKKGNIKLYPNPVKDILKLNLPNGEKIATIEVYNTLGQKVSDFSNVEEINLKELKSGVYIINLKNNKGKTYTSKIVKQ